MIFISYNHDDEVLVDMITRRLELEFGRDNIFYDKWSIKPGESIIEEMDTGLEKFTTFFFMLSNNSLQSNMVSKEWQAALMRHLNIDNLKFIPVRIDDCNPPAILADQLYIDLYGEGIENAVSKMKNVVKNESTYIPHEDANNIQYQEEHISEESVKITVYATMYAENNLSIVIALPGFSRHDFRLSETSEVMTEGNTGTLTLGNETHEVEVITLTRPLTVDKPFYVTIASNNKPIDNILIGQYKNNEWITISKKN